jgi:hypothetical protein
MEGRSVTDTVYVLSAAPSEEEEAFHLKAWFPRVPGVTD